MLNLDYFTGRFSAYFSKMYLKYFLIVTSIVGFVVGFSEVTEYARRSIIRSKVRFEDLLTLAVLKLPYHFQILLPFLVLLAAIMTFSRLNRTNELIVVRSFGVSVWQMIINLSVISVLMSLIHLLVLNPVTANFNKKVDQLERRIFSTQSVSLALFEEGLWIREHDTTRQSIIHIQHIDVIERTLHRVTFQNFNHDDQFMKRIDAEEAYIQNNQWILKDVRISSRYAEPIHLSQHTLPTELSFNKIIASNQPPHFIPFWGLSSYIELLERSGLSGVPYRLYWHSLAGKVGMMIAMVMLAAAFSMRPLRQGHTTLLIVFAVGSGLLTHFLSDLSYAMGLSSQLPAPVAAWAPALTLMFISATLILHQEER